MSKCSFAGDQNKNIETAMNIKPSDDKEFDEVDDNNPLLKPFDPEEHMRSGGVACQYNERSAEVLIGCGWRSFVPDK